MRTAFFLLLSIFTIGSSISQQKQFTVKYTQTNFKIDGILDEPAWAEAESAHEFQQYFPSDSVAAIEQTDIKMLYDKRTLYIGIRLETSGADFIVPSLERDFRAGGNDNISILFDTFNDGTNAFLFGMNPLGVQREGLISGGGSDLRGFSTTWDVKWQGEARIFEDHYIVEMAIPLTSLKFKDGTQKFRFNSYRFNTSANERSTWMKIPQNQFIFNLAFMGDMVFEQPLGRSRTPLAIIPYINGQSNKNFESDVANTNLKFGGDAKIAIGNGMNMDITINPDFSNVEVDNLVTNLTRFEIGLPERRQFFIDNSDLFSDFGEPREANPFFSRRIGIAEDANGDNIQNDIIGGVRLSGKLNEDWRLGFLNIQTEKDETNEIPSNNNTVFVLQKKVFSRSNLSFLFLNRETFGKYRFLEVGDRYNRVIGLDYNLASANNTWQGKFYAHHSFGENGIGNDASTGAILNYNSRFYRVGLQGFYVGDDFRSDLGFIRRTDILSIEPTVERLFWPTDSAINNHSISIAPNFIWRPELDFRNTDYTISTEWGAEFINTSELEVEMNNRFIYLTESFDPTNTDGALELPANEGYHFTNFSVSFQSDRRKIFSYTIEPSFGSFFNGDIISLEGQMDLRLQPNFLTSLRARYDNITLPDPFPSASIWIISQNFNVTFSKSIFWSTIFQYSSQNDNLGINTRLQWRFAPLSDLFIVYNDNYFTENFVPLNRSINLKLTYWLNL
ncbi:DUF5916 domain-containing protein [Sungkyunkwania multivorans]|uniref:DUF5916 domain-containing protein n=1 Tax=Sungkyunkwania multivorans TaxID=1173618 RepID=A0ABW3CVI6_9FLAO